MQLEGPDLEALLARVKNELGAGARIVRAEKVRTGGIAGFFAKQRFEVSVEVGDAPATVADKPADRPLSLLELADQVSDSEHSGLSLQSRTEPTPAPTVTPAAAPAEPAGSPTASGAGRSFASVLASLEAMTGTGPSAIPLLSAPQPAAAPVAAPVAVAPVTLEGTVEAAQGPAPADRPAADLGILDRANAHVSTEGSTFAALLANLDAAAGTPPAARAGTAVPQFLEPRPVAPVIIPAARTSEDALLTAPVALPVNLPFGRAPGASTLGGQLARLGLPAYLQPFGTDDALYPALLKSLGGLPEVPALVNRAGAVLAVVGPLPQSLETARAMARELGLPVASAVVLATSRRTLTDLPERQVLRDVDSAETCRTTWRRRRNLTIVAIDAPMTSAGAVQARAYLSALDASATWGAVEATRKSYDVGAFARAVGGFDALALSAVDETSDPAAVLELGIPVARLGEQPATPSSWAALLTGRVAA
ncbi:MAG: hypothetical protein WD794_11695 [Mycobacteriales bacterium]